MRVKPRLRERGLAGYRGVAYDFRGSKKASALTPKRKAKAFICIAFSERFPEKIGYGPPPH